MTRLPLSKWLLTRVFAPTGEDLITHQHFLMDAYSVGEELSVHALVDSFRKSKQYHGDCSYPS